MAEVITIGLDIAKAVFHAHGADASGKQVFSRRLSRSRLLEFMEQQPGCPMVMETCSGAHHWAREFVARAAAAYLEDLRNALPAQASESNRSMQL